jgi:hypothetical protein
MEVQVLALLEGTTFEISWPLLLDRDGSDEDAADASAQE